MVEHGQLKVYMSKSRRWLTEDRCGLMWLNMVKAGSLWFNVVEHG